MAEGRWKVGVLTLSDKGARGERVDESGKLLMAMLDPVRYEVAKYEVVPDEGEIIEKMLVRWADDEGLALVLTTGGTGVSPRDITPQATLNVVDFEVAGMAEAMRAESLKKTPHAMISRAVVGVRGRCLIVNLPGSPRGARENFEVVMPALDHAIAKIHGDPSDCAV